MPNEYQARCSKCKAIRTIEDPVITFSKAQNLDIVNGTCEECGSPITKPMPHHS